MEEASLDHGSDRLRFLFFSLCFFFISFPAFATSFGPISLNNQIENAQYVVRGRVVGSSWVVEERQSKRPYTHWKLQVIEQAKGNSLGGEVVMRQPGGELGGLGYHVAGTASFRGGEEVFVNLRDTDEPDVKEVMGLASGKYTVETGEDGKLLLRSGLGYVLKDEQGVPISPDHFLQLAERITGGKATEADKTIFVSKGITHENEKDHAPVLKSPLLSSPTPAPASPNQIEKSTVFSEESEGSSAGLWAALAIGLLALLVGVYFVLMR